MRASVAAAAFHEKENLNSVETVAKTTLKSTVSSVFVGDPKLLLGPEEDQEPSLR